MKHKFLTFSCAIASGLCEFDIFLVVCGWEDCFALFELLFIDLAPLADNVLISMLAQLANNALKIQWLPSGSGCYELYPPWLRNKQWGTMDLWMGKYFSPQGWNRPLLPPRLAGNGEKPPPHGSFNWWASPTRPVRSGGIVWSAIKMVLDW